jgi:hypothetical protein
MELCSEVGKFVDAFHFSTYQLLPSTSFNSTHKFRIAALIACRGMDAAGVGLRARAAASQGVMMWCLP